VIDLSIIVAGIRNRNWYKLYQSVKRSTKRSFEIIFVGPFPLLETCNKPKCDATQTNESHLFRTDLKRYSNIKYIRDWGSPNRCAQIGACLAEGKFLTWIADDCLFRENALDNCLNILKDTTESVDYSTIICTKYTEGDGVVHNDAYYKLNHAYPPSPYISNDWWIFNSAIMYTEYFIHVGGWDCQFEVPCCAHADLAIRAQRNNANVIMLSDSLCDCSHMPGRTGDHGPVHDAMEEHDLPLYKRIHTSNLQSNRIIIPAFNWKKSPRVWERRFG
jgi:hypothetical protein